ncbi:hypothetical protein [Iodobacter fluviatilis]|uniref:Uncharacterized protein n=1 Tax=Iodobacter fluviatilis TaxID=537 RepID=A0A7G3GC97_9NEIS|nr:hypothetical protein [Iodobacter fluviatilis]QBC45210.1 hypothetical protein C1H71_17830 [Iodobacter fluviatilis]
MASINALFLGQYVWAGKGLLAISRPIYAIMAAQKKRSATTRKIITPRGGLIWVILLVVL